MCVCVCVCACVCVLCVCVLYSVFNVFKTHAQIRTRKAGNRLAFFDGTEYVRVFCSTVVSDTMAGTGCRSVLVFLHSATSS